MTLKLAVSRSRPPVPYGTNFIIFIRSHSQRVMIFGVTSLVKACLTFYVDFYESGICLFRAMTLSPLHLVVNSRSLKVIGIGTI